MEITSDFEGLGRWLLSWCVYSFISSTYYQWRIALHFELTKSFEEWPWTQLWVIRSVQFQGSPRRLPSLKLNIAGLTLKAGKDRLSTIRFRGGSTWLSRMLSSPSLNWGFLEHALPLWMGTLGGPKATQLPCSFPQQVLNFTRWFHIPKNTTRNGGSILTVVIGKNIEHQLVCVCASSPLNIYRIN